MVFLSDSRCLLPHESTPEDDGMNTAKIYHDSDGNKSEGVWYEWKPGWYADRLHAVKIGGNGRHAVCGFVLPYHLPENATWFKNELAKGVARCKKCERKFSTKQT